MIGFVFTKYNTGINIALFIHDHFKLAALRFWKCEPLGQGSFFRKPVDNPYKLPRFEIYIVVAFLEVIEFFEYRDWDSYIIIIETIDSIVVV